MSSASDAIATLFTFLTFLFIIIAPMALAFLKAKEAAKGRKGQSSKQSPKKEGRPSLFEMFRQADRESEKEVHFTSIPDREQKEAVRKPEPKKKPESIGGMESSYEFSTDMDSYDSFEEGESSTTAAPSRSAASGLPTRIAKLPELQRAVVMAEVLGPPKGWE